MRKFAEGYDDLAQRERDLSEKVSWQQTVNGCFYTSAESRELDVVAEKRLAMCSARRVDEELASLRHAVQQWRDGGRKRDKTLRHIADAATQLDLCCQRLEAEDAKAGEVESA